MRKKYDNELEHWKKQAVTYNDYQQYGTLFDRNIPLDQKKVVSKTKSGRKNKKERK